MFSNETPTESCGKHETFYRGQIYAILIYEEACSHLHCTTWEVRNNAIENGFLDGGDCATLLNQAADYLQYIFIHWILSYLLEKN